MIGGLIVPIAFSVTTRIELIGFLVFATPPLYLILEPPLRAANA